MARGLTAMAARQQYPKIERKVLPDPSADIVRKMNRAVRKAEREAGDGSEIGGTGQTVIKLSASPMQRLVDRGRIGGEELRAAQEITLAVQSIAGALWIKPQGLEKRDRGYHGAQEPAAIIDAVDRYRAFAGHWSALGKRGHPLLQVVFAALIDERGFREIENDARIRNGSAEKVFIAGLRDYAARAGWVSAGVANLWKTRAQELFRLRPLDGSGTNQIGVRTT